jgi:1,4-alpha-glucan branching enzyme
MIAHISNIKAFGSLPIEELWDHESDHVLAYKRDKYIYVFNFDGIKSYSDYGILAPKGTYKVVLNSDDILFGGYGNIDESIEHITIAEPKHVSGKHWLKLYIPARTVQVLEKIK